MNPRELKKERGRRAVPVIAVVILIIIQGLIVLNGHAAGFEGDRDIVIEDGQYIQAEPAVASHGGDVYAVWSDYRSGHGEIYLAHSADAGKTFPDNVKISDLSGGNQISPAIAANGTGSVFVAWQDSGSGKIRFRSASDVDGVWGPSSLVDSSAEANGEQKRPAIAADGSNVYVAWEDSRSDNRVDIIDAVSGSDQKIGLSAPPTKAKYSPDGTKLAILLKGEDTITIYTVSTGSTSVLTGHTAQVNDVAWSPDSSKLLSVGNDKKAIIWDIASGSPVKEIDGYSVAGTCAWSPADNYLAVGFNGVSQGPSSPPLDVNISLYDTAGTFVGNLTGHTMPPTGISWAGNGTYLASSSTDTKIMIWNADTVARVRTVTTFIPLYAVSYSPDSSMVATGGKGGYLRVINATTGSLISNMQGHQGSLNAVSWASNSTYLVSGGSDCRAVLWTTTAQVRTMTTMRNRINDISFSPGDADILVASGNIYGTPSIYFSRNTGSGFSAPVKINDCNMGSRSPAIAAKGQRVYVVWSDERSDGGDIYVSYSDDGGATFSANMKISTGSGKNQYNPDIAVNSTGAAFAVWQDEINKNEKYDIYTSHSDDGSAWSAPVMVNNGSASYYASTTFQTPTVAITADDVVHTVWADNRNGDMDIYYSESPDGSTWSDSIMVNDNSTMPQYSPDICAGYDNSTDIVWQDYRNGYTDPDIYEDRSPESIAPSAPSGVAVSDPGLGRTLYVSWVPNPEPDIGGYRIYRNITGAGSGGPYVMVGQVNASTHRFEDRGVKDYVTYYYVVTAIDNQPVPNESPYSPEASGLSTDVTPPKVVSSSPEGSGVAIDTSIAIRFDETVNTSTVRPTFKITWKGGSMGPEDGLFFWSIPASSFIFDPTEDFNYSTTYTVSLGPGIEDIYGNAMNQTYTWNFTTRPPLYIQPSFPASVGMHDSIIVSADILSEDMVEHVFIQYTDIDGQGHNESMAHVRGTDYNGTWEYTIPAQNGVGTVSFTIWADDSGGNTAVTDNYTISVKDTEGPIIRHAPPYYTVSGRDTWINATVTDESGIDSVQLFWSDGTASYVVPMNGTGDTYTGIIPARSRTGTITYTIIAYDTYGNMAESPQYTLIVEPPDEMPPTIYPIDGASSSEATAPHAGYQESIPVYVRVSDDRHVLKVTLWYMGAGGDAYISSDMILRNGSLTDGVWRGYIPQQNTGGIVRYFIEVYDGNNTVRLPKDAPNTTYIYVIDGPAEPSVIQENMGLIALQLILLGAIAYLLITGMKRNREGGDEGADDAQQGEEEQDGEEREEKLPDEEEGGP